MSQVTLASPALKAYQVMSHPLFTVEAGDSVQDAASLFLEYNISGAPVIDANGKPVGVITKTDIARFERDRRLLPPEISDAAIVAETRDELPSEEAVEEERVDKWMTPDIYAVGSDASLDEICRSMIRQGTHHIFVRDEKTGRLLGVVTSFDLLKVLADFLGRRVS